jgi:hypothetical protein
MRDIVAEIASDFTKKIGEIITEPGISFAEIETASLAQAKICAAKLMSAYAEALDGEIAADKKGRRENGYTVHRRGDERRLQTLVGEVSYRRTYYKKAEGGYEYLTDTALGVEGRDRVSGGLSLSLATAAKDMSYEKSSRYVSEGEISRQTVMSRVRRSTAAADSLLEKRRVPELHIDADEAHVTLCGGKKSEVPLISVYEGIVCHGKRHNCRNIFHISEYGKDPNDLWEQVLTEIERRYDLSDTRIYLHGDGGAWIRTGFEWIPNAVFVLDKYHKNKAIKAMLAVLPEADGKLYDREIRWALDCEDLRFFDELTTSICAQAPEREKRILAYAGYLKRFVKGISICKSDPNANNGGCTEPHVSHVLSARLSGRPMAWSRETLERIAPVLASGQAVLDRKPESLPLPKPLRKAAASARKAFRSGTAGLPHPDSIGSLPVNGKITGTQKILRLLSR